MQIPQERREQVEEVTMTLICSLRSVFSSKSIDRVTAKVKLHEWYPTNAHSESLNSKLKGFRAQLRGVQDLPIFMFRTSMIFG